MDAREFIMALNLMGVPGPVLEPLLVDLKVREWQSEIGDSVSQALRERGLIDGYGEKAQDLVDQIMPGVSLDLSEETDCQEGYSCCGYCSDCGTHHDTGGESHCSRCNRCSECEHACDD
jgi:hypothetical protein